MNFMGIKPLNTQLKASTQQTLRIKRTEKQNLVCLLTLIVSSFSLGVELGYCSGITGVLGNIYFHSLVVLINHLIPKMSCYQQKKQLLKSVSFVSKTM